MTRLSRNPGLAWTVSRSWRARSYFSSWIDKPMSRSFRAAFLDSNYRVRHGIMLRNGRRISWSGWNERQHG